MILIQFILMSSLDLPGFFFNMRMLWSCLKDKTKHKFLKRYRALYVCQCVCQLTILAMVSTDSWRGYHDVLSLLFISVIFFQACNLTAILTVYNGRPMALGNRELSTKLKLFASLFLLLTGAVVIWWYSSFPQEFNFRVSVKIVFFVSMVFLVVLFVPASRIIIHNEYKGAVTQPEIETKTCNIFKENERSVMFITLLILCLLVIVQGIRPLSFSQDFEKTEVLEEVLDSLITRFVFGIVLPVVFTDMIDFSSEDWGSEMKTLHI